MKFIDEATISVKAGHGGRGCVSFRREKHVPRGGPDGGGGGRGGDVVLAADSSLGTLLDFKYRPVFKADSGTHGQSSDCHGANADPLIIPVPCGTTVYDDDGEIMADLVKSGDRFLAAKGGRGGHGNTYFKSSTNRAPRNSEPGEPGQERRLRLELKLIADVGLVGLPNAGKSTLISRISAARPKIADYPFTTLVPNLGVVNAGEGKSFVVADLPGLIRGAAMGHGLGIQFLKHIERTRIVLHLVDCRSPDPITDVDTINQELVSFDPELGKRPQMVVITKADLDPDSCETLSVKKKMEGAGHEAIIISSISGHGLPELIKCTADKLGAILSPDTDQEEWQP